jgi:hypothetical protein
MRLQGIGRLFVASAGIMVATSAFAQGESTVTIAPFGTGAPLLGSATLGLLAIVLAVAGAAILRRRPTALARALGVMAIALSAATAYSALPEVVISGDECHQVTQELYVGRDSVLLRSECPNPIRVVAINLSCSDAHSAAAVEKIDCSVGLVIPPGETCLLPSCPS